MAENPSIPIDTLRLNRQDRQRVIEDVQRSGNNRTPAEDRRRLRVNYGHHAVVALKNPDGAKVRYAVAPRNLSSHGMGFIHGQYIHADRPCDVMMPNLRGEWVMIHARVRTCRHLTKLIHDVGVVFDSPINLDEYVKLTPEQVVLHMQQAGCDSADGALAVHGPMKLTGQAVVADNHVIDGKLYSLWLEALGLKVRQTTSTLAIQQIMDETQVNLMLVDAGLGNQPPQAILQQIRLGGFTGPLVVATADETSHHRAQLIAAGASAVIAKPVDRDSLHQLAEQLMLPASPQPVRGQDLKIRSQLADDARMKPLIQAFIDEVDQLGRQIEQARSRQDTASLAQCCTRLKNGAAFGFTPLTRLARQALDHLGPSTSIIGVEKALDDLLRAISRVCVD